MIDEHFGYEARDDDVDDGVLSTLTHDVDHNVVGNPTGPAKGRDEARGFYEHLFADLDAGEVTPLNRYYGDDLMVDESLWKGIAVGNPLGLAGRNRPVEFRLPHVFEFADDGAISRENVWMDTGVMAQQLADESEGDAVRDLILRFYDDFDRGELGRFEATVFGSTKPDWTGFIGFALSFLDACADRLHVFDHVVTEGDTVATIGRYQGTHTGDLMGVSATGRTIDMAVMHIDRVVDGRVVEHRGIGDIDGIREQLGVTPPS